MATAKEGINVEGLQSKPGALSEHLKGLWATDGCVGRPQRAFERSPLRAERCRQRGENETTIAWTVGKRGREEKGKGGREKSKSVVGDY